MNNTKHLYTHIQYIQFSTNMNRIKVTKNVTAAKIFVNSLQQLKQDPLKLSWTISFALKQDPIQNT